LLAAPGVELRRARKPREKRCDMIGRAPQQAIACIGPELDGAPPRRRPRPRRWRAGCTTIRPWTGCCVSSGSSCRCGGRG
jgi:hypothetical protein